MAIEVIRAEEAVDNVKGNMFAYWRSDDPKRERVIPLAKPDFKPSFRLKPGDKVFTIGSCFARNVENALLARGFRLPARDVLTSDPDFATIGPNLLNNYGVPSIHNEIKWALKERRIPLDECLYEMSPGKYVDIHLNAGLRPTSLELFKARRQAIYRSYRQIGSCSAVIITLGLAECWFDKSTLTYVNTAPRRQMIRQCPGRFELHVLDYDETATFLHDIVAMIANASSETKIILTVSPVPLMSTHRQQDVMQANMYSKSVLRTAAEEVVNTYPNVDYFPSFESVLISDRNLAWESYQIHVRKEIVDGFEAGRVAWLRMQLFFLRKNYANVILFAEHQEKQTRARHAYRRMLIQSYAELGDLARCKAVTESWANTTPTNPGPYRVGAVALSGMGAYDDAEEMFRKARVIGGDDPVLRLEYSEHLAKAGKVSDARNVLAEFKPENAIQGRRYDALAFKIGLQA